MYDRRGYQDIAHINGLPSSSKAIARLYSALVDCIHLWYGALYRLVLKLLAQDREKKPRHYSYLATSNRQLISK